ncbi:MAG: helix-turn-helix domain-containing protein [Gemmataceae bacterium]|nr:helix-turn-helix domain-containing protein [Gemmataceae bacterium]
MATRIKRAIPDTYFQLVKELPLTHIRDDAHLRAAQMKIDQLLAQDLDVGQQAYLDVLTDLVEAYEEDTEPMSDASEVDVLRELLRSSGLSQPQLAKKVGIAQSTISAVLNGSRSLTKDQIIALARFFHVAPAAFLPSGE